METDKEKNYKSFLIKANFVLIFLSAFLICLLLTIKQCWISYVMLVSFMNENATIADPQSWQPDLRTPIIILIAILIVSLLFFVSLIYKKK